MPVIPRLETGEPLTPAADANQAITISYTDAAGVADLPIDPEQIARVYDVQVYEYDLPRELSGYLDWDDKGAFIVVNQWHGPERKRFTIAHELGHYYDTLRRNLPKERRDRGPLASTGTDIEEIYANRFAAALLMPAEAVKNKFVQIQDVGILARTFNVSKDAMGIRLNSLGLV